MRKLAVAILLTFVAWNLLSAEDHSFDAFAVMEEVRTVAANPLWPGFDPAAIPAAVFDGKNTFLFHSASIPEGFTSVDGHPGVYVYSGQHPRVVGNSRTELGGTWFATAVLKERSPLTGNRYTDRHRAAILVHEMFHVFQKLHHEDWRPNEAVLFAYPLDTQERLALRRKEMRAFVRALEAENEDEAAGWAATALRAREERLAVLGPIASQYEDELSRFEGLGDYIERRAAGKPLSSEDRYQDFSPGVVRDLGYLEGRWMAGLLDRLVPGWKADLEAGAFQYLREPLARACEDAPLKELSKDESRRLERTARHDFRRWLEERAELRKELQNRPGFRIIVDAEALPLNLSMFMATHTEALASGELLHRRLFAARNSAGSLQIRRRDCVSLADDPPFIVKVTIPGLSSKPEIARSDQRISIELEGIKLEFDQATVYESDRTLLIQLGKPIEDHSEPSSPP